MKDDAQIRYHSHTQQQSMPEKVNPSLSKKGIRMIEKLKAKIDYFEVRDDNEEAAKLREKVTAIEDTANARTIRKAQMATRIAQTPGSSSSEVVVTL